MRGVRGAGVKVRERPSKKKGVNKTNIVCFVEQIEGYVFTFYAGWSTVDTRAAAPVTATVRLLVSPCQCNIALQITIITVQFIGAYDVPCTVKNMNIVCKLLNIITYLSMLL